jgi:hypothetical protein
MSAREWWHSYSAARLSEDRKVFLQEASRILLARKSFVKQAGDLTFDHQSARTILLLCYLVSDCSYFSADTFPCNNTGNLQKRRRTQF